MEKLDEKPTGTAPQAVNVLGELKVAASAESLEKFISFISRIANQQGFGEQRLSQMAETATEVFNNIVQYAFGATEGEIEIKCTLDRAGRIVVKTTDTGKPFNMLLAGDPLFAEEYREEGLTPPKVRLVKKMTETIEYQRIDNKNYLIFTFSPKIKG